MPAPYRVGLAGLGLIGGSLGFALTKSGLCREVLGYDPAPGVGRAALESGAITAVAGSLLDLAGSEIIIAAAPVRAVVPVIASLLPYVRPGTIITDTASIKGEIIRGLAPIVPEGVFFIGGHPMAGSERAGLAAADPYLFENAAYVLTTRPPVPRAVLDELTGLLSCTGARFVLSDPEEHDLIVAAVSHLPHAMAAALINTTAAVEKDQPGVMMLAGGGLRDTTRIAGGNPCLWTEILSGNRGPLLEVLRRFQGELSRITQVLEGGNEEELTALLESAQAARAQIPLHTKGLLGSVEEMVVALEDRPGSIKQILDVLAGESINVKDIEILRLREGEGGTLRLAVENQSDLAKAISSLQAAGISARRR